MTRDLKWRIIALQIVVIVVFALGSGMAFYASNFTHDQVSAQLTPQKINFPKTTEGLPQAEAAAVAPYVGQQVVNGVQAHVFAENYLGLHLRELADGKVYSELSAEARAEKDPALKAQKDGLVQTAFRGETLRSMLNQAWAFWTLGDIAWYAGIGLAVAAVIVFAALIFEVAIAPRRVTETASATLATVIR